MPGLTASVSSALRPRLKIIIYMSGQIKATMVQYIPRSPRGTFNVRTSVRFVVLGRVDGVGRLIVLGGGRVTIIVHVLVLVLVTGWGML